MRLIDADALHRTACGIRCGCEPDECGYEDDYGKYCEIAQFIENAPTIEAVPLKPEIEHSGGGSTWWNVCGACKTAINPNDKYCHECGVAIDWGRDDA